MKQLLKIVIVVLLTSCGHRYESTSDHKKEFEARVSQKMDTLIVRHQECTECLDLYIEKGNLTIPSDILKDLKMASDRDIKVCGNFPKDLIDMTSFNFDSQSKFRITGKVIMADTNNAIGFVPLFYVDSWEKE